MITCFKNYCVQTADKLKNDLAICQTNNDELNREYSYYKLMHNDQINNLNDQLNDCKKQLSDNSKKEKTQAL